MQQAFTKSASADVVLIALLGVAGVSVSAFATTSFRTSNQAGTDLLYKTLIPFAAVYRPPLSRSSAFSVIARAPRSTRCSIRAHRRCRASAARAS